MNQQELLQATDEQILDEVKRLQYLFGHSKIIRHGLNRDSEQYTTQSVAEHIYNMMILAQYFRPLEDPENKWDWNKIHHMILWHDAGELETGDIIAHQKTNADEQKEIEVYKDVLSKSPVSLAQRMEPLLAQYANQESIEDQFVNALDRLEAQIYLFNVNGKYILQNHIGLNYERAQWYQELCHVITQDFLCINKVMNINNKALVSYIYNI